MRQVLEAIALHSEANSQRHKVTRIERCQGVQRAELLSYETTCYITMVKSSLTSIGPEGAMNLTRNPRIGHRLDQVSKPTQVKLRSLLRSP